MASCKNCNQILNGIYCSGCGEKVVESSDFTLSHILTQAIGTLTNFDSKLFKSFRLLFFRPGQLTEKYITGLRVAFMKPFQLFVITNLIFFFFLSDIDLFRTPSRWFFQDDFDGIKVMNKVRELMATQNLTQQEVAHKYDVRSSNLAKGLIIFLIPFIALITKLLHLRKKMAIGKHIIFATHYFTFVLLFCVLNSNVVELLTLDFNKWMFILPVTLAMTIYYAIALRTVYKDTWIQAIWKGLLGVFLINVCIQLYRVSINLIALNGI